MKLIFENPQPKIRVEKEQYDSYTIYNGNEEIGYAYCNSYYSQPKNRLWNVVIEVSGWKESDVANSVRDIKVVAQNLYDSIVEKNDRWQKSMED
jgi:hypothetical protein